MTFPSLARRLFALRRMSLLGWVYLPVALLVAGLGLSLVGVVLVERTDWGRLLPTPVFFWLAFVMGGAALDEARRATEPVPEPPGRPAAPAHSYSSVGGRGHRTAWRRFAVGYLVLLAATIWTSVEWGRALGTVDLDADDISSMDRAMWLGMVLLPGLWLAWAWTWRLGRWLSGAARPAVPVGVEVFVAHLKWRSTGRWAVPVGPGEGFPAALWLRLSEPAGTSRYQRVAWNRGLVTLARAMAADGRPAAARARRCVGFRRMYLVHLPGVGRVWPTSTARRREPNNYDLLPYDRARTGTKNRSGWGGGLGPVAAGAALVILLVMAWALAGPVACAYVPVLVASYWLWQGGTPLHGVYAHAPAGSR
jgi:hypothetical protein